MSLCCSGAGLYGRPLCVFCIFEEGADHGIIRKDLAGLYPPASPGSENIGTDRCVPGTKSHIEEKNGAISQYYLELYDWYVRHAERLVPRPEGAEYPIWLFLEEENKLPPLSGSVCLELEILRDLVVLTDVERWGYRVNYLYIPMDEKDRDAREAELKRNGIGNETALIQTGKGNFYPLLKRKIIQSWDRVFEDPATGSGLCQGTVWELKREWLRGAVYGE